MTPNSIDKNKLKIFFMIKKERSLLDDIEKNLHPVNGEKSLLDYEIF